MAKSSPPDKITARKAQFYNLFFICYLAAMLLRLRQWGSARPWARLDRFSGGYLLLSILWLEASRGFLRTFLRRNEISGELSGASYDRWTLRFSMLLPLAELAIFLDYGHWRLMPTLARPSLQWTGLALSLLGALLLFWTDRQLLAHFAGDMSRRELMETGPYRFIRHPRYLALLLSRISLALALASPLGWGLPCCGSSSSPAASASKKRIFVNSSAPTTPPTCAAPLASFRASFDPTSSSPPSTQGFVEADWGSSAISGVQFRPGLRYMHGCNQPWRTKIGAPLRSPSIRTRHIGVVEADRFSSILRIQRGGIRRIRQPHRAGLFCKLSLFVDLAFG